MKAPSPRPKPSPRLKLTIAQFCMRILFAKPLTNAERQARHRAKHRAGVPSVSIREIRGPNLRNS